MKSSIFTHLYFRIWVALVAIIAVLSVVIAVAWILHEDDETRSEANRSLIVRDAQGNEIMRAPAIPLHEPSKELVFEIPIDDAVVWEDTIYLQIPARDPKLGPPILGPMVFRSGRLFLWVLVILALAVALGAYPVTKRLTRRLKGLQNSVEQWGSGQLQTRASEHGNDEIAYLARRFNQAASQIEKLVRSHKTLLANASHELRSPLARIRMAVELQNDSDNDEQASNALEIKRNIAELDQLIDEILLASRLDAPGVEHGQQELSDFSGLVTHECVPFGAEIQIESDVTLVGYPRLLQRMVRNLLENAARYANPQDLLPGSEKTQVQVQVHTQTRLDQSQWAILQVSDYGPGVPQEFQEQIFTPFFRLPGASERSGGVGLGLALVKSIVQLHGGSVRCTTNAQGGACFIVELPIKSMLIK